MIERGPIVMIGLLILSGGSTLDLGMRYLLSAAWVVMGAGLVARRLILAPDKLRSPTILFAASILLLVSIQLLPVPAGIAGGLVNVPQAEAVRAAIGDSAWRPLSVDPVGTGSAAFSIAVFLVTLVWLATGRRGEERKVLTAVCLCAGLSLVLGLVQKGTGGAVGNFYDTPHIKFLPGLFTNRNHAAIFLACGMVLAAAPIMSSGITHRGAQATFSAGAALTLAAIIAMASRSGLIIGSAMLAGAFWAMHRHRPAGMTGGRSGKTIAAAALLVVPLAFFLALRVQTVVDTASRFEGVSTDLRWQIYANSFGMAVSTLPFGSGLGTFVPLYAAVEPLDQVWPSYINHAHSDWLELIVETGVLWIVPLAYLVWSIARRMRQRRAEPMRGALRFDLALIVLAGIALHSFVDYPVRSPAVAIVVALCLSTVLRSPKKMTPDRAASRA